MRWNILDRNMHVLLSPDTRADASLPIYHDKQTITLKNNCAIGTYDFSVNQQDPDAKTLQLGNYISFVDKYGKTRLYTLMSHDGDEYEQTWHAEDIGLDLINEVADKWKYNEPHSFAWYAENLLLYDSGWSIGINEIGNLTRSLTFDGQSDSVLTRLGDLANQFDGAELDFEVEMSGSAVTKQVINVYKKLGSDLTQQRFVDAVNLKALTTNGSINDLRTAMIGYGSTPDNGGENAEPITFANIEYDDGRYFTLKGDKTVCDRVAGQTWARAGAFDTANKNALKGYIVGIYTYETKDPNELLKRTITNLKTVNEPQIGYEADLLDLQADIGDTVQIAHRQYNPPIYLSARVQEVENCYTEAGQDTGKLGNYQILESNIDPRITDMISKLATQKASYIWLRYADDDKGTNMSYLPTNKKYYAMVTSIGSATPSDDPADYAGHWIEIAKDGTPGKAGVDGKTPYFHTAWADSVDGKTGFSTTDSANKSYLGTYADFMEADSTEPSKYNWALFKGPKGDSGADGLPGKDGVGIKSTQIMYAQSTSGTTAPTTGWTAQVPTLIKGQYLWTQTTWVYTDNTGESGYTVSYNAKDGNNGSNGVAGKDGVGIKSTNITYASSTSGTTAPTSGWTSNPPSTSAGHYIWTKTVWAYTDGTSETGYSVGKIGDVGPKGDTGDRGLQGIQGPQGSQGIQGPKGTDGKSSYTHIAYATSSTGSGFSQTPTAKTTHIGMYVDQTATDSTDPSKYKWTLIKGADGSQGTPGKAGTDGKTPYLHTAYSWSADGTDRFMTVYPGENLLTGTSGILQTVTNASHWNTNLPEYTPVVKTVDNATVYTARAWLSPASHGMRVQFVWRESSGAIHYDSGNLISAGTSGYSTRTGIVPAGATIQRVAIVFDIQQSTGSTVSYKEIKLEKGSVATPYTPSPLDDPEGAYPKFIGTYTDYVAEDSTDPAKYTWAKIRGEKGPKGDSGADGKPGKDGLGIKSTAIAYQLSSSGTTTPTGTWSTTVPTLNKGKYLWTRTTLTYTDNSSEPVYSVTYIAKDGNSGKDGIAGKDGVGIKSTTITYATSTSGTSAPTSGWVSTPPSAKAGQFIWTRTIWTYTDNTTETGYSVGKIGEKGATGSTGAPGKPGVDGKGIASTTVKYQASTSGTNIPTGTWLASIPAVAANQYLWTRTTWSYTDNTSASGYSVGKMGSNGDKGDKGDTGNGIKSVVASYQNATSGTVIPTGSWVATPPNTPQGQYLWTRNLTTFTNGGTSTSYSVAYSAKDGPKGDKGDPGSKDIPVVTVGTSYPAKPKSGDIHWLTNSSGNVIGYYVYNGSTWVANKIDAKTIAAETFTGLTFTGNTFNGSQFNTSFKHVLISGDGKGFADTYASGTASNNGAINVVDGTIDGTTQKFHNETNPSGTFSYVTNTDGKTIAHSAQTAYGTLSLTDWVSGASPNAQYVWGTLSASDIMDTGWQTIVPLAGATVDPANPWEIRRVGHAVYMRGAVRMQAAAGNATVGRLPELFRPDHPLRPTIGMQTNRHAVTIVDIRPTGEISKVFATKDVAGNPTTWMSVSWLVD